MRNSKIIWMRLITDEYLFSFFLLNIWLFICTNLLLTEREGRTGEYWPEVVAVRTERSEVRTKRPRADIPRYGSS